MYTDFFYLHSHTIYISKFTKLYIHLKMHTYNIKTCNISCIFFLKTRAFGISKGITLKGFIGGENRFYALIDCIIDDTIQKFLSMAITALDV